MTFATQWLSHFFISSKSFHDFF